MKDNPLITIIIRTCNRPHILRYALESVKQQTYKNIEVIVVEDGKANSVEAIHQFRDFINIKYIYSNNHIGRAAAGNMALQAAVGDYINFLDDDDLLYPNHIELLVKCLTNSNAMAAYSIAKETRVKKIQKPPYFKEIRSYIRYKQPYNRLLLANKNYLPIQSVLFSKKLYLQLGGFDTQLEYLEDWDLWVRYSTITDYIFLPQITSEYRVPWNMKKSMYRNREFYNANKNVYEKFIQYNISINLYSINRDIEYILADYCSSPIRKKLREIKNKLLYKI